MASTETPASALISRTELAVLEEYRRTAQNLDEVRFGSFAQHRNRPSETRVEDLAVQIAVVVQRLSAVQPQLLAELRPLEHKLGLILTLFKGEPADQPGLSLDAAFPFLVTAVHVPRLNDLFRVHSLRLVASPTKRPANGSGR